MARWTVKKFVKSNGRCPIDDRLESKKVTQTDKAKLDTVIEAVEATMLTSLFPPEKVKKYHGTELYEVKVRAPGKQLRPLAIKDSAKGELILLSGAIEKDGALDDLGTAITLAEAWKAGNGSVKDYWEN